MGKRFIIEGEWSGYRSSQQHVAHRSVHPGSFKKLRAWAEKTHAITYTDGTQLWITVRDCKPRERVVQKLGYKSLIEECAFYDVNSVQAVIDKKAAMRSQSAQSATV